jgi:hypothetical protein
MELLILDPVSLPLSQKPKLLFVIPSAVLYICTYRMMQVISTDAL